MNKKDQFDRQLVVFAQSTHNLRTHLPDAVQQTQLKNIVILVDIVHLCKHKHRTIKYE